MGHPSLSFFFLLVFFFWFEACPHQHQKKHVGPHAVNQAARWVLFTPQIDPTAKIPSTAPTAPRER